MALKKDEYWALVSDSGMYVTYNPNVLILFKTKKEAIYDCRTFERPVKVRLVRVEE